MKSSILIGFVCVLLASVNLTLQAQDRTVTGKVTSADDGTALPGVSVVAKGTTTGTTTDIKGEYSIAIPDNATLVFSFIGLTAQEVAVGNRSVIDIVMTSDIKALSEVVLTGYGGTVEKRSLTGSIASVSGDKIQNMPVQSFDRALQGRAAGVLIQSANGLPGGVVQVRVRGTGSITAGNDPLYVVDGVQINNSSASTAFTSTNPLNFLNPNDIESIEVLKDAAAASVYGAQASNGVVLITTKKGKAGKTQVSFSVHGGVVEPIRLLDVLNTQEWIQVRSEAVANRNPSFTAQQVRKSVLESIRLSPDLTDEDIAALPTYDWQREAFKSGATTNYEFSLNGGNDKTTFYWSGAYNKVNANIINVDFKRASTTLKLNQKVNSKFTLDQSVFLSSTSQTGAFGGPNGGTSLGSAAFSAPLMLTINPIRNPDGSYYGPPPTGTAGALNQNVIQVSDLNSITNRLNQLIGSAAATYKITDDLFVKAMAGLDYRNSVGHNFTDPRTADGYNVQGRVQEERGEGINFTTNAVLNYSKTFAAKHTVGGLLGAEYRSDNYEEVFTIAEGVPTSEFQTSNSAANPITTDGFSTGYRRAGVFGQVKYEFDSKYLFNASARYDGSSRFGESNLYGFFPSVSVGWLISEEDFIKNTIPVLSSLKLRASHGSTGNDQIGNFDPRGLFGAGLNYNGVSGMAPSSLENPSLRWEKSITTDIGLDFGLWNDRVSGTVDWFNRLNKDLLLSQSVPNTAGYDNITRNTGELYNRGWEFELTTLNVKTRGFEWATDFNFTAIDNKVTKLFNGIVPSTKDSLIVLPNGNNNIIVGKPVGTIFLAQYAGVNPATGRPMWYDADGNLTYTVRNPTDFKVVGDNFAEIFGGITNTFRYKGLELAVFFQYEFGRKAVNGQSAFMAENGGRLFNSFQDLYDRRWLQPGDITDVPRPIDGNAEARGSGATTGSRFVEDASYFRLKQISLSYQLPGFLLKPLRLQNVKVYGQGINLHTWSNWSGFDAEWINTGNGNTGVVPIARTYIFGLQFGF